MGKTCFDCGKELDWKAVKIQGKHIKEVTTALGGTDEIGDRMDKKDVICFECAKKFVQTIKLKTNFFKSKR